MYAVNIVTDQKGNIRRRLSYLKTVTNGRMVLIKSVSMEKRSWTSISMVRKLEK